MRRPHLSWVTCQAKHLFKHGLGDDLHRHPLIRGLKERVADSEEVDESTSQLGRVLFESALLESGFVPEDAKSFSVRVQVSAQHS